MKLFIKFFTKEIMSWIILSVFIQVGLSSYQLNKTYMGKTFFDDFNFDYYRQHNTFSAFQDKSTALSMGLINTTDTTAYIGVDHTNIVSMNSSGRPSVEMLSYHTFDEALWILNASHMPYGCGKSISVNSTHMHTK